MATNGIEALKQARAMTDDPPLLAPSEIPEAVPFPVAVFPPVVREFVHRVADSIPVPVDLVALPVLITLATAIGTQRAISPKQGWSEWPCLYGGIVAPSGIGKSPAIKAAIRPLLDRQEAEYQQWTLEKERRQKDDPPPVLRHVLTTDATVEALGVMLSTSPRGLLMYRDELVGWVAAMDAYRNGKGADRQFWLDVHSTTAHKVDRKGGQDPIWLKRPLINVLGGFTPVDFDQFVGRSGRETDGFYQRILFTFPPTLPHRVSRVEVLPKLQNAYSGVVKQLFDLPELAEPFGTPTSTVAMEAGASELWWTWYQATKEEESTLPEALQAKWEKFAAMSLRVALVLHETWGLEHSPRPVNVETTHRAIEVAEYFKGQERRIWGYVQMDQAERRDQAVYSWITRRPNRQATVREVLSNGVAGIKKAREGREIFASLVDRGWACWIQTDKQIEVASPD